MSENKQIKAKVEVKDIQFYNGIWGVVSVSPREIKEGTPALKNNQFTLTGEMEKPVIGQQYYITAIEQTSKKWGVQYKLLCIANSICADLDNEENQKKFLLTLFTKSQVAAMYETLPNPFESFYTGKMMDLIRIKGCGIYNAAKWMSKFNKTLPLSKIYLELEEYNLTNVMIEKLLKKYHSADVVINTVKNNPYSLCEIEGVGWAKADKIALSSGINPFSFIRVEAYLQYYLDNRGMDGFSWVTTEELMGALLNDIGEEVPDQAITEAIRNMEGKLWWNEEKTKIGLKKYRRLEEKTAKELFRLIYAKNVSVCDNWKETIIELEQKQGWQYTKEQKKAIQTILENNVTMIHGLAGTGKSTVVAAITEIIEGTRVQCALSGRAAARLKEITKEDEYTIHRLLGYPCFYDSAKNKFLFHDGNLLPYDYIIIDEISMLDGYLFYYLIRAIKSGAKVIMLGDIGQLESIGCCNIASDMIYSGVIPVVELKEIHRQAKASAIITEGMKVRHGIQIINPEWADVETRGELQDLVLDCYSDKSNTFYKTMQYFSTGIKQVKSIFDLQVIAPVKMNGDSSVWSLNNAIQELYNPASRQKKETLVSYGSHSGILREGDKVINRKNKYNAYDFQFKKESPIFNGNIGMIDHIDLDKEEIIIDFQDIGKILIEKEHFRYIQLGYAISLHSAQGSEFERVIFAVDFSSYALLTRQLIYTAFTRAKKHCTVVAQNSALWYAVSKNGVTVKQTHLKEILNQLFT